MRENIELCRGERMDNIEWIEGFLVICDERYFILPSKQVNSWSFEFLKKGEYLFGKFFEVFPDTVGQFTGLTVANGKVFDGDFLKFGDRILEVFWNSEAFQWQAKQIDTDLEIYRSGCGGCHNYDWTITDLGWIAAEFVLTGEMTTDIIGNKWDNPEILKVKCTDDI